MIAIVLAFGMMLMGCPNPAGEELRRGRKPPVRKTGLVFKTLERKHRRKPMNNIEKGDCRKNNAEKQRRFRERMKANGYKAILVWAKTAATVPTRTDIHIALHCQICGKSGELEGHHADYSKPLEIIWVCKNCHSHIHSDIVSKNEIRERNK
jgi:hypothetical protein